MQNKLIKSLLLAFIGNQGLSDTAKLTVVHPTDLMNSFQTRSNGVVENGVIKSSLGNFGHFQYGTTLKGRVHYPLDNVDGCSPFQKEHFNEEHFEDKHERGNHPIIMVDRGNCHFVIKA